MTRADANDKTTRVYRARITVNYEARGSESARSNTYYVGPYTTPDPAKREITVVRNVPNLLVHWYIAGMQIQPALVFCKVTGVVEYSDLNWQPV